MSGVEKIEHYITTGNTSEIPLITDIQFGERFTSASLNRHWKNIKSVGIYAGFAPKIVGIDTIEVGDSSGKNTLVANTASGEYQITVHQQKPISFTVPRDQQMTAVVEAFFEFGVITKQVNANSDIDAATLTLIPSSDVQPHHVQIFSVLFPSSAPQLLNEHLDLSVRKDASITGAYSIEDANSTFLKQIDLATEKEATDMTSLSKVLSPARWKQAFLSRLSNAWNGTRQDYAVSEKALSDGLADAIAQLHETGWGSDQPRTITNFNDDPETWSDGSAVLFRCISSTANKPDDKVGVGMLFRYMKLENSPYMVAYHATDGTVYTATWDTANNQWIELSQSVTNGNLEAFVTPITKAIMNRFGLSGRAPSAASLGLGSNDLNDITEDCQHLTLTGEWKNTPFGDDVGITGQLTVYRRYFDAGAAVVQILHFQDGQIYHRVGSGVPITFPESWNKLLFANEAQNLPYDPDRTYYTGETCTTTVNGAVYHWEAYHNQPFSGKNPSDEVNRQVGWTDETKPWYWSPLKKARAGTPLFPWMSMTFPEGTLNVLGNSVPVAVFWRLAEALPEFVNAQTGMIDFPETGAEFFRVLDQGRGIDPAREFGSYQKATIVGWNTGTDSGIYGINLNKADTGLLEIGADEINTTEYTDVTLVGGNASSVPLPGSNIGGYAGASRSRNLAFPILVEV